MKKCHHAHFQLCPLKKRMVKSNKKKNKIANVRHEGNDSLPSFARGIIATQVELEMTCEAAEVKGGEANCSLQAGSQVTSCSP